MPQEKTRHYGNILCIYAIKRFFYLIIFSIKFCLKFGKYLTIFNVELKKNKIVKIGGLNLMAHEKTEKARFFT